MNYYYDLTLNFGVKKTYKFYEWELDDNLVEIKKIPLFKIDEKQLVYFYLYNGIIDESFLKKIKNRTTYKINGKIKNILYAAIFTDTKSSLALVFDNRGKIIGRSNLLLEDELNIIEIAYSVKKENIVFHKDNKRNINHKFRQKEKMVNIMHKEITKAYQERNNSKLIYYYLEWFNKYCDEVDFIFKSMINELKKDNPVNLNKMYELMLITSN